MPPRLGLVLESPRLDVEDAGFARPDLEASISITDAGTLQILSKSYQAYKFTKDGMSRTDSTIKTPNGHQFYKISEQDVRILKTLGRGASSVVQKAYFPAASKFVAIKKINCFEKEKRHQMMNDVKALCDIPNVPGLVQFIGAYHAPENGEIAIVLEYMNGGSLSDVTAQVKHIPEDVLSRITAQVLQGLVFLHSRHTVHRDIKPANILVDLDGGAKITDFGISAFVDNTLAVCNTFLGTVTYMSPERINSQPYSFPADIWSLGLALLECATGQYPYDASVGPLQLMIQVVGEAAPVPAAGTCSEEFCDFISQCLQKDPFKRPSADALLKHAFIQKFAEQPVDLKIFMKCVFNPEEWLEEMAVVVTSRYYSLMSAGKDKLALLAALYTDESILSYEGVTVRGRAAIMAHLKGIMALHAAFGRAEHKVEHLDIQKLHKDGCALVHVEGQIKLHGVGAGLGGSERSVFAEAFALRQSSRGEYYITNQLFMLLR
ncbi:hypothetical protein WJX72_011527 [[Myrmecia] bisecta]|uniref:mitogen-activated protein kinase kinase n=1 Tax=[Myrmecia] bisecta TaxID=41462 RepID=A0AAW1Q4W5_9CHLO